jgi:hypothetical protein
MKTLRFVGASFLQIKIEFFIIQLVQLAAR